MSRLLCLILPLALTTTLCRAQEAPESSWTTDQVRNLPESESPVHLFNGRNLTGWHGQIERYWSVEDGVIVARNTAENAPAASTYLLTDRKYRNFRLIFEAKLVTSEMHSGVSLWGEEVEREGDPFSYKGHLVMFPSNYGFYDLYRRNSIYRDKQGVAKKVGRQHGWNRMEILAVGSRIRFALNGHEVADWTDPRPELCRSGPLGLQLHRNKVAQEVQFRGLVLTEDPENRLVTAAADTSKSARDRGRLGPRPFEVEVSGSGPPVVLIPGLASSGEVWDDTVSRLREQYECHVLTLAGFGGQPPIDPPLLSTYRDGVIEYIRRQQLHRPILIGHSLGGFLTYWIAATNPESAGLVIAVDGLPFYSALSDPAATPQSVEEEASRRRAVIQNANGLRKTIQNRTYLTSRITAREDLQTVAAMSDRSDPRTVGQAMYEMLTTDVRDELVRIRVPVLLIGTNGSSSTDDERRTKETRYRQQVASIPDHTVVFHTQSRHFIQYDAPEFLWQQLNAFLSKHESAGAADSAPQPDEPSVSQ